MRPPRHPGSYLVVELTNRCSLACVHCAVSQAPERQSTHHGATGWMDPALFEGLVDDLVRAGAGFDDLVLFWLGEPLLHPHFARLYRAALRAAVRHGTFGALQVHTNATHLDDRVVAAALNDAPVPQTWAITLDAATAATYAAVKGRDRFARVEARARRLVEAKGRTGARWPRLVFQFIVGSNNAHEARAFRDTWTRRLRAAGLPVTVAAGALPPGEANAVFFRQLDAPTPAAQERENAVFQRVVDELGLRPPRPAPARVAPGPEAPCSAFWLSPVVGWDGRVTTCTRDADFANAVGSIRDTPFPELWWGPAMARRRDRVARADYRDLPLCQGCFIPRSLNHAPIDPAEIRREAAWRAEREAAIRGRAHA